MDSPPPSPQPPPPRRRALWQFLALSFSLLAMLVVLFLAFVSSNRQLVWLTPAQIAQAGRPGLLARLKSQVIHLAGPLMRFYRPYRPNIMISASILKVPSTAGPPPFGEPFAKSEGGMSAWILSPAQLDSFRQALKANPRLYVVSSSAVQTTVKTPSRLSALRTVPGCYTNVGATLDATATATASSGSINLLLEASYTQVYGPPTNGCVVKTNFSTACRVMLPDAGALLINCGNADPANPTNYWVVVSPVLVDATGQPIKH